MLSPLLYFNPTLFWLIEGQFFKYLLLMVAAWGWTAGYKYYEVGEDISSCYDQGCLVIANHQSTADVPTFMTVLQHKSQIVPKMMWIMDRMFKFTNFGLVSLVHGDFFIQAGKNTRQTELDRLRDHLQNVYCERGRQWIVLYPEGGFLRKRKETSQKYARENNLPHLENVSLPRVGALHTIINTLHPKKLNAISSENHVDVQENGKATFHSDKKSEPLKWIIDATIGYHNGNPVDLPAMMLMLGKPSKIFVYYRRYPVEEVPTEIDELTKWLYDRFAEKEQLLAEFYRTGSFPQRPSAHSKLLESPRAINFDNWCIAFFHILFILSTLFHYWLLSWILVLIWPF